MQQRRRTNRALSRLSKLFGFGSSVAVLAATTLLTIPAMVAADGEIAWGVIALGQAIGGIGAVAIAYGWGLSGPAKIAGASPGVRRAEYLDSLRAKVILTPPVFALAAASSALMSHAFPLLAAAAAVQAASVGMTGNWYFVGVAKPYSMLLLETVPRASGAVVGIILMHNGASSLVGLGSMVVGTVVAFLIVTGWVLAETKTYERTSEPRRTIGQILADQRHGLMSHLISVAYLAAPIAIVTAAAPGSQPVFALVDKLQKQITSGLAPVVTVLQGWIPRGSGRERVRRARVAMATAGVFAVLMAISLVGVAPVLLDWLGGSRIPASRGVVMLMAALVAVAYFESVLAKAALASFGRLRTVAWATLASVIVGLPLVALGAVTYGAVGALCAVLIGLLLRVVVEGIAFTTGVVDNGRTA